MTREQSHVEDHEAPLLESTRDLGQAEEICRGLAEEVRLVKDALVLAANVS